MRTYSGTETVKGGYYLNVREAKLEAVDGRAGTLPGEAHARYVRVPLLAMLLLAPLLGLLFVVVLPFLGLAVLVEQGWHKAAVLRARRSVAVRPATNRRQ
jgi:hypothetical protein